MKRIFTVLLAITCLLSACAPAEGSLSVNSIDSISSPPPPSSMVFSEPDSPPESSPEPEPDNSWQFDTPENHRMDSSVLEAMHTALPGTHVHAVIIVKDGVIIDEYYEDGYDENSIFEMHSGSKSYTSALIGIAIEQGYIDSIDDPAAKYLPQLAQQEDPLKQQITLRHLLTHTSGLEWYEWNGVSNFREWRNSENWVDYIVNRKMVARPGSYFSYSTGGTHLLSAVLESATGMSQAEFCRQNLLDPMGVSEAAYWRTDPQGIADGGNGIFVSARDAAKFGQFFLDGGEWKGQQLVPADWVEESTSVQNAGPGGRTGQYGYQWWVRTHTTGEYGTYATPLPERKI